jgi:hypothetical protein
MFDPAPQQLHRCMSGHVAGIALEADALDFVCLTDVLGQQGRIVLLTVSIKHAVLSFEYRERPLIAARSELRGDDTAFGGAAKMQPLYHAARSGFRERKQTAAH